MPGRRPVQKGSFAGHFDELVKLFPEHPPAAAAASPSKRSEKLQEKIDIHALLFERAWEMDGN
jgi:hypothetical protein